MGQVPILEYDGVVFCQSTIIARFLAKKYNLAGKDDVAAAEADQWGMLSMIYSLILLLGAMSLMSQRRLR